MTRTKPTNVGKLLWPGVTKGDFLDYLTAVGAHMLPQLKGRPLTVVRAPDGVEGEVFFQKNAAKYTPDWINTVTIPAYKAKKDVRYVLCDNLDTLLWLGNQASVELHVTPARVPKLDRPDVIAFDLDPPPGRFDLAQEATRVVHDALTEAGLRSALKTTGGKGLHIVVPIQKRYPWHEAQAAVATIAERAIAKEPSLFTSEFLKAERGGRVLLDTGRNALGATFVAAWSTRSRPEATVSFPLAWTELDGADPADYTIRTAAELTRTAPGPREWADVMGQPQALPAILRRDTP